MAEIYRDPNYSLENLLEDLESMGLDPYDPAPKNQEMIREYYGLDMDNWQVWLTKNDHLPDPNPQEGMEGVTYRWVGDFLLPNLSAEPVKPLNHWGQQRLSYLKNHRNALYSQMIMEDMLNEHCHDIGETAQSRYDLMMEQAGKTNPYNRNTEQLKWVGWMTGEAASAREIIGQELIYN